MKGERGRVVGVIGMVAVIGTVILVACGAPPPPQQFTLRIGLLRTVDGLPYFVMRERGLDKQHRLHFVETMYEGGGAVINALAANAIDVGPTVGPVPAFVAADRGVIPGSAVIVAANNFADPDHPGAGVLAGTGINSWKDLEGKPIGVVAINSVIDAAFRGRLQQENVRGNTVVEIPFQNLGLAVAGGNVAAAVLVEPWLTQSLLRGDGKLLGWVLGGPPFERAVQSMIVFKTDFLRKNPEAVKAFLRAYLQAVQWINQNPDGARAVLSKALDLSQDVSQRVTLSHWPVDARNDAALLESMQLQLVKTGLFRAQIPASTLCDETLLNEVLKEKR